MQTITTPGYAAAFLVGQTPQQVFNAINNVGGWWSTNFEGRLDKPGDIFTVRFGEVFITSKVVELISGKKIVWDVIDCNKPWLKNKKEWNGTTMSWEISKKDNQTQISFTHIGLLPEVECYEVCSNAWGGYINNSLRNLVTTGKGNPTTKK